MFVTFQLEIGENNDVNTSPSKSMGSWILSTDLLVKKPVAYEQQIISKQSERERCRMLCRKLTG